MSYALNLPPFDLRKWLAENDSSGSLGLLASPATQPCHGAPRPTSNGHALHGSSILSTHADRSHVIRRAASYVGSMSAALSGSNGHGQTFDAACALIKGFGLTINEARPILQEWNAQCQPPWSTGELEHKLTDADEKPDDKPRGYLLEVDGRRDRPQDLARQHWAALNANGSGRTSGANDHDGCSPGTEDDPHRLARLFVDSSYRHHDGLSLRFWREEFHEWNGSHFVPMPRKEVSAKIARTIESEYQRIYEQAVMLHAMKRSRGRLDGSDGASADGSTSKAGPPKKAGVTTRLVGDVTQAISDITLLCLEDCPDQPAWIGTSSPTWSPHEVLPTKNALIHLPSYIDGDTYMRPPTPLFFSPYSLSYTFDPNSPEPSEWFRFLSQLWPDDPASIHTLQEWMGYLLTPDTSQQKILMLIGPKRSGKGTILRVIRSLIGANNVVNPTLSSMATNFGLAPLIGKTVAIITDSRISGRTDTAVVIERLLSISGEDAQTIDRKYRTDVTTSLLTRFMIVSNELPRVKDASGALAGRMLFLQLTRSFFGQEDTGLLGRLIPELPGILMWAIDGWARLRERGYFVQPPSGADLLATMEDLSSPTKAFLRECCRIGTGEEFEIPTAILYQSWRTWCSGNGQEKYGNEVEFGRNLRAALPEAKKIHPRKNGDRVWCYSGLRLLEGWETNNDEEEKEEDGNIVPF